MFSKMRSFGGRRDALLCWWWSSISFSSFLFFPPFFFVWWWWCTHLILPIVVWEWREDSISPRKEDLLSGRTYVLQFHFLSSWGHTQLSTRNLGSSEDFNFLGTNRPLPPKCCTCWPCFYPPCYLGLFPSWFRDRREKGKFVSYIEVREQNWERESYVWSSDSWNIHWSSQEEVIVSSAVAVSPSFSLSLSFSSLFI